MIGCSPHWSSGCVLGELLQVSLVKTNLQSQDVAEPVDVKKDNYSNEATEQYFPVVLFIVLYKVVLTFACVEEIRKCDPAFK